MPGRILVVDDVATNRIILKVKLTNACYEVLQAGSGTEALRMAQRDRPDLILLDMGMSDLSGLEVCRRLKADRATSEIPVVIVTSKGDTEAKLAALKAGADEFMSKPLDDMGLLARIRSLLRARGIAAELALREGTTQALGFAEPASDFAPAGHVCIIADDDAAARDWRDGLRARLHDRVETCSRDRALNPDGPVPDVFVVTADLDTPGGGLLLLSDLRSRLDTRHSAIIVAVRPEAQQSATMALDLGASDLVTLPINIDELVLRLKTMMDRKRQSDRLRSKVRDGLHMAVTDPLTGLYNRRYALSHLERVRDRAAESGKCFAVMLADLDQFKSVNDTHGHAAGDEVLKAVAARLTANLRSVDLVARIGGEEFLVVLPEIAPKGAQRAAERMRTAVSADPIAVPSSGKGSGSSLIQTVSIGLAIGGGGPAGSLDDLDELLKRADRALYDSKEQGRNRVTLGQVTRAAA